MPSVGSSRIIQKAVTLDRLFFALSHPLRRQVLQELKRQETLSVGDVVEMTQFAQPTITRHLKILADVGLIQKRRWQGNVYCLLVPTQFARVQEWLETFS